MDHGRYLQPDVDADDIARLPDWLWQHDLAFACDRERDEPAVSTAADRRREHPPHEPTLPSRLLQADTADVWHPQMPVFERHLVQPGRVTLALLLEARVAGLRPFAFNAPEEPLERDIQVLQRRLSDV